MIPTLNDILATMPEAPDKTTEAQQILNDLSRKYLADTDWYAIRKSESNIEIPAEVAAYRTTARANII